MGVKADAAQRELDAFKELVRTEAIRVAGERGWCDTGLNRSLRTLGLREKHTYSVNVRVQQPQVFTVAVLDAENRADAIRRLHADPEIAVSAARTYYGGEITREQIVLPELPAETPAAAAPAPVPGAAPRVGDPKPAYGVWHSASSLGRQCLEHDRNENWCTRDVAHESPHVASDSRHVLAVWAGAGPRQDLEWPVYTYPADVTDDDDDDI